jgi:menaquinone-9 beta-reductase
MVERAQQCGVTFAWNTPVNGLWKEGVLAGGANRTNRGNKVKARWIVGADGSRSRVRGWAGLETSGAQPGRFALRQHYRAQAWSDFTEVHWKEDAQAYVTPVSSSEICVAFITKRRELRGRALQRFPNLAAQLTDAALTGPERGAMTRTTDLGRVSCGNVVLVGDASGTVDAITGEGLALGFRQSLALADALVSGNLREYEREHLRILRRARFMSRLLLFLSRSCGIRRRTFQVMHAAPHIFDCMLAYHVGETRPLELAATGAQFGWRFLTA